MSQILRLPDVKVKTGLGRSTIYALIARREFPKPILLGSRAVGFLEHEIDAWIIERIETSRGKSQQSDVTRGAAGGFKEPATTPIGHKARRLVIRRSLAS